MFMRIHNFTLVTKTSEIKSVKDNIKLVIIHQNYYVSRNLYEIILIFYNCAILNL